VRFLVRDATREELRAACVDNHLVWLRRLTEASGGQVRTGGRVMRATTWQPDAEATVAVLGQPNAGLRDEIDAVFAQCRSSEIEVLSFWSA
jgi:hypothetical protein